MAQIKIHNCFQPSFHNVNIDIYGPHYADVSVVSNTRENDQWSGLGQEFLNLKRSRNPYREENSQPYNLNKQLKVHQCSDVTVFYSKMF